VIDLSCEACHAGGIGLSWCTAFPRSSLVTQGKPIQYHAVNDVSGVPVNNSELAVILASPGNGETFYTAGNSLAPEIISGRVYTKDQAGMSGVKVRLEIISDGQTTAVLETSPSAGGDFNFNVGINPNSPPAYSSKPATRQCTQCHNDSLAQAGIPTGTVHFVVTASAPDGQQATDSRWARVDASESVTLPVQVVDAESGEALSGLSVQAFTILYEWRERFGSGVSDTNGSAQLKLEELSQAATVYDLSIPPQILNGMLYASPKPMSVTLEPHAGTQPTVQLTAQALKGQLTGTLMTEDANLQDTTLWAIQYPAGPVIEASTTTQNTFAFEDIPIGQYLLTADAFALAEQKLAAPVVKVDLFGMPETRIEMETAAAKPLWGSVGAEDTFLPFGWVSVGKQVLVQPLDPSSSGFLIPNLPPETIYITASAPGYYVLPRRISPADETSDFQLKPRPETQFIKWNDGLVTLPPETEGSVNGLEFELTYGWLWGQNDSGADPLQVHLPNLDVEITGGKFALEVPAEGTGWLYIHQGQAKVMNTVSQSEVTVRSGEMIALTGNAEPLTMQPAVIMALHPALESLPVFESIEPTPAAKFQSWLTRAGIGVLQVITFVTYILSLATLLVIVLRRLFLRRNPLSDEEKLNAGK